jgi:hypothetical protein
VIKPRRTRAFVGKRVHPLCFPLALLTLAAIVASVQSVDAECVRIPLSDAKAGAHFVFEAIVTREVGLRGGRHIVDLDVGRVWKGEVQRRTRLFHDMDSLNARRFEVGSRYVILAPWFALLDFTDARRVPVDIAVGGCGWGSPYAEVEAELTTVGRAKRTRR